VTEAAVTVADIERARLAAADVVRQTPVLPSATLGDGCAAGVVCGSAGNHAQALASAARARGVPCEVFMPAEAPIAKAEGAAALGATVRLAGATVEDCVAAARERAADGGLAFVHPYDDPHVVAGQGTLGLELLEDVPDLAKVVPRSSCRWAAGDWRAVWRSP
jgi:threonine dehydratase